MHTQDPGHGPVRYGPPLPDQALPVLPELTEVLAAAAAQTRAEPLGGGRELLAAARGYWARRGLPAPCDSLAAAPGSPLLLLAVSAALGGDVLLPRPCSAWWAPQARMLERAVFSVPTAAESGGVPDPYALLETVRRVRAEGGDPRVLVLSVADDPTATVAPPEVLHETVEAAIGEGLHIVSDETLRDTLHQPPHVGTPGRPAAPDEEPVVVVSPAEMVPDGVSVITDLAGAFLPPGWPAAIARFPDTDQGRALRARALDVLMAVGGRIGAPVAAAAAYALAEPAEVTARLAAAARLHAHLAGAAYRVVTAAGALARTPQAGRHLYADLEPLRPALAARGVADAQELEDLLTDRLGVPVPGGHRFGDDLSALRVRLSTGPLLGTAPEQQAQALAAADPCTLPHVAVALDVLAAAFGELRDDAATRA